MKEILFKAKGQTDEKWHIGFLANVYGGICIIRENEHEWICQSDTICQYTGLTDKNDNKIWENDVAGYYSEYREEWYFAKVTYGHFNCNCCDGVYGWTFANGDIRDCKSYEVKGNIFDNPELIGE